MDNVVVYTTKPQPAKTQAGLMSPAGVVSLIKWYVSNYSVGGGVTTDHGDLTGLGDDTHPQYPNISVAETISANWSFTGVPNFADATVPFTVTSTAVVTNLNAERLDSQQGSFYRDADNINAGTLLVARGGTGLNVITENNTIVGNATAGTDLVVVSTTSAANAIVKTDGSKDIRVNDVYFGI